MTTTESADDAERVRMARFQAMTREAGAVPVPFDVGIPHPSTADEPVEIHAETLLAVVNALDVLAPAGAIGLRQSAAEIRAFVHKATA
jgi:hypothetical protein